MGDSIMAASTIEDKIGGSFPSDRRLEVSVSFGRFENDSLSWDKWSSFSQNKYLEEVEKCATPGSVAQKKAYFEAHYKKIASRKAEISDQKIVQDVSPWSNDRNGGDSTGKFNYCGEDSGLEVSNGQFTAEEIEEETKLDGNLGNISDVEETNEGQVEEPERVVAAPSVKEGGTQNMASQELKNKLDKEPERIPALKVEPLKPTPPPPPPKEPRKVSPLSKVRDTTRIKKKPASPVTKSPQISTVRVSKTVITSSPSSTHRTPTRKASVSPLPKNKICSLVGSKKVAPQSLHMSLSMDTPSPDPAPPASASFTGARKSFIMEKMKDKEIVKRAFKTFQNNVNQLRSSYEEKSLAAKQVPSKGSQNKVSSSITPRKENAGSLKALNMDKKTAKTAPSSFGLKSNERAEKSSEKLQGASKVKLSESTRLQTKSKDEKATEIRKLRHGFNFRTTPMPGFYHGHKLSRSPLDKEGSKTLGI